MALTVVLLLVLAATVPSATGLQCYTCVYNIGDPQTCITSPNSITGTPATTDCHQGKDVCCTITKQVYKESKDDIVSFSRGCQPNCPDMNDFKVTEDWSHIFYQTYCDDPLCNTGPGDKPPDNGGGGGDDDNIIPNIPGENSAPQIMGPGGQGFLFILLLAPIGMLARRV